MGKANSLDIEDISSVLSESAAEGLIVTNKVGEIQIVNPRIREMFGYDRKELLGQKVEVLIPEQLRHRHVKHRAEYNEHPSKRTMGIGMDLVGQRKDGSQFPVEVSLNYFFIKGQKMIMALISDVTQRKKTDLALQKLNHELEQKVAERTLDLANSQRLYRLIARNFPNGIINVFDRKLNYVFVEGQELYRLGIKSERLVGQSYLERLAPEVREDIRYRLLKVFKGENTSFEIKYRENTYMLNAVGLPDEMGEIAQVLMVEQNITRLKEAEEGILEALKKERELSELKSRFVSMASHEFRTPLTTVQSSLSLLKKYIELGGNEEKREKHIHRIRTSVHHLTNILNDFLSIDRLAEGRVELHLGPCKLPEYIPEVIDELRQMAKQGQSVSYRHHGEAVVVADQQMLKNIIHNLVSNAIKYSGEEGVIAVNTQVEKDTWHLQVTDEGIGIPAEEQSHLFDRFFRARNVTNIQGTGLGLSITARYVDLLKGSINFESKEGEGTSFQITLPTQLTTA
ncbi:MAG: PAS domain-containing sensor histidine kinase [Owenweeksia sp.]|nr:PAS domain-containing sensor histidine kinase [Owenweeksia sp.]